MNKTQRTRHILDFSKWPNLPCPTIAAFHAAALGRRLGAGNCLLRLPPWRYRRQFSGLPESLLGLHPGLGGTARLPALIPAAWMPCRLS